MKVSPASVLSSASSDHHSSVTKASISLSRSTTSRTATDWTRPALNPVRTFFQSSGLTWYPTSRSITRRAS